MSVFRDGTRDELDSREANYFLIIDLTDKFLVRLCALYFHGSKLALEADEFQGARVGESA